MDTDSLRASGPGSSAGAPGRGAPGESPPVFDIRPPSRWSAVRLADLWQARELLFFLALRDVKVRYKQAFIGVGWAVLQPVLMMVVFWIFLGKLAHIQTGIPHVPYAVFAFAGLIPWLFFANGVTAASETLVANTNLISKVYFPRLIMPMASVLSWLPDVAIATVVLIVVMAAAALAPGVPLLALPLFVLLAIESSLAASVWLSALNVAYRDIHYAAPFFIQVGLFLTPVTYPASLIRSGKLRVLYALNPMNGVVEGFRWAMLGRGPAPWTAAAESLVIAGVVLLGGLLYFRRAEQFFADVI
jgi:lipopolysaccharide transport system permease protein